MIKKIHEELITKKYSAIELAREYLLRLKKSDLNAFITITKDEALAMAKIIDKKIASKEDLSLLAGVPMSVKDVIMTTGVRTTAGSKILENYVALYDATAVAKLKDRGAVILGKNNCDEFAMGGSGENSAYGPAKNPFDKKRVPGGSSSGSAVAVAADLSVYSLGSDTGGSVRQPAAFCGVVGFKPTYGAVSRQGLIAMASSLDQIGVLAKTVEDAEIVFDAIKGKDEKDATSIKLKTQNSKLKSKAEINKVKIGIPKEYFVTGIDEEIRSAVEKVIKRAEKLGAEIMEISLPHTEYALTVYYIIQPAEASANLARYDGVRYSKNSKLKTQNSKFGLIDIYKKTRAEFLGEEVKRRIMLGTYALSAGYYDAYYKKAQQVRTLIRQDFEKVFSAPGGVDLLITPTTPHPAWKIGEKIDDPLSMYLEDIFTMPVNVAGLPALSMPGGQTKSGLPIGVQIIGPWGNEDILFEVGKKLESIINN